ncbi:MAG: type IV pilus secretin PilQ [Pseudomonadota bacterium]
MKQFNLAVRRLFGWMGMMLAVCALSAHAQSSGSNAITGLNVSETGDGVVLRLTLKEAPAAAPTGFSVNTPPRVAFDFPAVSNESGKSNWEINRGDVRSVSLAQAGGRTRVVLNLGRMLAYETRTEGKDFVVLLHAKPSVSAPDGVAARFAEATPDKAVHRVKGVDFRRGKNGEGRVIVDLSDTNIGIDIKQQGSKLIVDFAHAGLPRELQRKLDVVDFGTPVQMIDTYAQGDAVRMVIDSKGKWENAAYQTDNRFIVEIKPASDDAKAAKGYSGEKLTLSFQNITVREALNVIADFTNLNMVISDTVGGSLTLRLKDVPWDQALDIILQSKGLDMRRSGNVIQVAPRDEMTTRDKNEMAARQEMMDMEEVRTESFQLSYQKGADMAALLSNDKQRILSKRGSAVVDARTNTLFVQDTPTRLEEVRKLIKQIDVPVRQVMIEARVVNAANTFSRNLGARLGITNNNLAGTALNTLPGTPTPPAVTTGTIFGPTQQHGMVSIGNVSLPNNPGNAGNFALQLFNAGASKLLTLELQANETDGNTKTISAPRVVTADKAEAVIESGAEIPYTTPAAVGAIPTTSFKKATLSLKVTPQITPDENVNLKVNVTKDSVGTIYNGVPSINTNRIDTQVLVEDGGTVVIGGIYVQDLSESVNKVPLLGDVPIVGNLFKSRQNIDNKTELLIFISPKILRDQFNIR